MLVFYDPIVILDHLLHEIDHIAFFIQGCILKATLLHLSQHSLVLDPSYLVLNLLDLVSLDNLSPKFAESDVGDNRTRTLHRFLLLQIDRSWSKRVAPTISKSALQFLLFPALLLKRCIHSAEKDYNILGQPPTPIVVLIEYVITCRMKIPDI